MIIIVIMMIKTIIMIIMMIPNKIPVDSPHKRPIMLSFDVTFVESKSNSRVSGDLRRNTVIFVLL